MLTGDELCQVFPDRALPGEVCGRLYRATGAQAERWAFAFVSMDDVMYFSVVE